MDKHGYLARGGQIIDASIVPAPKQHLHKGEKALIKEQPGLSIGHLPSVGKKTWMLLGRKSMVNLTLVISYPPMLTTAVGADRKLTSRIGKVLIREMGWKTWEINVFSQITLVRQTPVQTSLNGQFSIGANIQPITAQARMPYRHLLRQNLHAWNMLLAIGLILRTCGIPVNGLNYFRIFRWMSV